MFLYSTNYLGGWEIGLAKGESMPYDCWRGMVGIIKPTKGSGSLVELIEVLPDGIG